MSRPAAMLMALVLALLAVALSRPALADPADIAAAGRGAVRVVLIAQDGEQFSFVGHGSGFAVTPTLVVTNAHVVAPAREDETMVIGVVPPEGKTGYTAKVVAYSPENDLALLRLVDEGSIPPLTLFTGAVEDGSEVFAVGYPGNVDLAQGLGLAEIVEPQTAVKTRGYLSAGRSSRQFESLLHTAPVGQGNSGGPLLDNCGRVIGVNSFGALSGGADSEFYFAVSMRELLGFLREAGVQARTSGNPCRSIAELDREEMDRAAGERGRLAEEARRQAAADQQMREKAERRAELQVLSERENGMALAALALLLAIVGGGAAAVLELRGRRRDALIAGGAGVAMLVAAVAVWFGRPSLESIEERTAAALTSESDEAGVPSAASTAGALVCVLDQQRSRVTVSEATDVKLGWRADGCVNGRTQYGLTDEGWSRILVPKDEPTVSVARFDPETRTYRVERYLLELPLMSKARQARAGFEAPACGGGEDVARQLGRQQAAIRELLPARPNERLVYRCEPR